MLGRDLATTAALESLANMSVCVQVVWVGAGPSRAQSGQVRPSQAASACQTVDQTAPGLTSGALQAYLRTWAPLNAVTDH